MMSDRQIMQPKYLLENRWYLPGEDDARGISSYAGLIRKYFSVRDKTLLTPSHVMAVQINVNRPSFVLWRPDGSMFRMYSLPDELRDRNLSDVLAYIDIAILNYGYVTERPRLNQMIPFEVNCYVP